MREPPSRKYREMSATEFRKRFGKTLEEVGHGQPVRIIRKGRRDPCLILLREDELAALQAHASSPLESLREQLNDMVARMQTPTARKAAASLGAVKPSALGKAALRGRK